MIRAFSYASFHPEGQVQGGIALWLLNNEAYVRADRHTCRPGAYLADQPPHADCAGDIIRLASLTKGGCAQVDQPLCIDRSSRVREVMEATTVEIEAFVRPDSLSWELETLVPVQLCINCASRVREEIEAVTVNIWARMILGS